MAKDERLYMTFQSDADLWPFHDDVSPDCYVYLVAWPDGVVKIGTTSRASRWRRFIGSGAGVLLIVRSSVVAALEIERLSQESLGEVAGAAFADRSESLAHLPGGHGWTECYRSEPRTALRVVEGVLDAVVQG